METLSVMSDKSSVIHSQGSFNVCVKINESWMSVYAIKYFFQGRM